MVTFTVVGNRKLSSPFWMLWVTVLCKGSPVQWILDLTIFDFTIILSFKMGAQYQLCIFTLVEYSIQKYSQFNKRFWVTDHVVKSRIHCIEMIHSFKDSWVVFKGK